MCPWVDYLKVELSSKYSFQTPEFRIVQCLFEVPSALFYLFLFFIYKMTNTCNIR